MTCSTHRVAQALNGTFARTIFTVGPGRVRRDLRSLVSRGVVTCLGLKADGSIVAWGGNDRGQCDVPAPNADFVAVTGGGSHSLGIKACILGDLDCDGVVDLSDLAALLAHCGMTSGATWGIRAPPGKARRTSRRC